MKTLLRLISGSSIDVLRPVQAKVIPLAINAVNGTILEIPTGEGKSPIGMIVARHGVEEGRAAYYVTPTKAQVEQVGKMFPDQTTIAFGRGEYLCLYYADRGETYTARESPCYMLKCPHRVNMDLGTTEEPGVTPCPYYQAKYNATTGQMLGKVTVCTTAFFLTNRLFKRGEEEEVELGDSIIFDEGHNLAKIARGIYEFTLTDFHLKKAEEALKLFDPIEAILVRRFRLSFVALARAKYRPKAYNLLEDDDIVGLLGMLNLFNAGRVESAVRQAIDAGVLDEITNREEIKLLENLVRNIPMFVRSLKYSLPEKLDEERIRQALNYVVAFYYRADDPDFNESKKKSRYCLTIKAYYVVPLIRRAIGENAKVTVMSATIGNPDIFGHETGLRMPFHSSPSSFDSGKTRIFMPYDTPNLSSRKARQNDPKKARKMTLEAVQRFLDNGKRSLIVVSSDEDRRRYMEDAVNRGMFALTYSEDMSAREVAMTFREGSGDVLIGTEAQFCEGLDLPAGTCPVIFFIKPGYQRPDDPMTQFEEKRFSQGLCWSLWQYRVMLKALQVRGRNIRSIEDLGVCFFVSQQFRSFLYGSLPEWLQPSFVGMKSMNGCVDEALELLTL